MRHKKFTARLPISSPSLSNGDLVHLLPPEIWLRVFEYCNDKDLCNLQRCNSFISSIVRKDSLWIKKLQQAVLAVFPTNTCRYSAKELYGLSKKWLRASANVRSAIDFRSRHIIPWLQITNDDNLWASFGNRLCSYQINADGYIQKPCLQVLNSPDSGEDFCRFSCSFGTVAAGTRNGELMLWDSEKDCSLATVSGHSSDVHSVHLMHNMLVSGSRDKCAKIWRYNCSSSRLELSSVCLIQERVWSVAFAPDAREFAVGTAALSAAPHVMLWDTELAQCTQLLGSELKRGAGAPHVLYEGDRCLLSAGYDTYVRLWDLRTGTCVLSWPEMYDNAVFCMASDQHNTIFAGTCRFGLIWAYDKRACRPLQKFYASTQNSPVYSLAFTPKSLYAALDTHVAQLTF